LNESVYLAQRGESMYLIAKRMKLDLHELMAANPGIPTATESVGGAAILLPEPGAELKRSVVPPCPSGFIYTIRAGDTFWLLAQRFGTTVEAIQRANPGLNPRNLQIGQRICIPPRAYTPPACPAGFLYTIRPGDTFWLLAQRFGTTVEAVQRANPGVDPRNLQSGQVICIPVRPTPPPTPPCPGGFLYTIQPGDTFFLLAQRFGTTVEAIQAANPGVDPQNLQVGQQICIPVRPTPSPPPCPSGFLYTIGPGDTFFLLAQRFGTTVQAIEAANPGVNPRNLQVGQVICIPVRPPVDPRECPDGFLYTIRAGDTLFLLALRFGITVQAIQEANSGLDPQNLQVGQVICIPSDASTCPNGFLYTIEAGDTLFLLAQRFGTTVQAIEAANPGIEPENLRVGQVICIPQD